MTVTVRFADNTTREYTVEEEPEQLGGFLSLYSAPVEAGAPFVQRVIPLAAVSGWETAQ